MNPDEQPTRPSEVDGSPQPVGAPSQPHQAQYQATYDGRFTYEQPAAQTPQQSYSPISQPQQA